MGANRSGNSYLPQKKAARKQHFFFSETASIGLRTHVPVSSYPNTRVCRNYHWIICHLTVSDKEKSSPCLIWCFEDYSFAFYLHKRTESWMKLKLHRLPLFDISVKRTTIKEFSNSEYISVEAIIFCQHIQILCLLTTFSKHTIK